jgi:hypothetical protein
MDEYGDSTVTYLWLYTSFHQKTLIKIEKFRRQDN